jgi:hypothetical protein
MLVAEFEEKYAGTPKDSPARKRAVEWRTERLIRYRAAVLELVPAVLALRADCGIDPIDLPHGDDDVPPEHSRIRAAHEAYRRQKAGLPVDDDVDAMVDSYHEALVDFASREGGAS